MSFLNRLRNVQRAPAKEAGTGLAFVSLVSSRRSLLRVPAADTVGIAAAGPVVLCCFKQVQLPLWIGLPFRLGDVIHAPGLGRGLVRGDEGRAELVNLETGQGPACSRALVIQQTAPSGYPSECL